MDLIKEALIDHPDIRSAAERTYNLQKKAIIAAAKKKAKAAGGPFSLNRALAKSKADLLKKILSREEKPSSDEHVLRLALESDDISFCDYLKNLEESSNFIKSLVDKGISKDKAEKAWEIASDAFKKGKYKDIKGEKKYKIIAGLAKKIALKEDGEIIMGVLDVTGSAINTTNIGGRFAAKLGEPVNIPGKYNPDPSTIFTRHLLYKKRKRKKSIKESIEINNYVDNLFE